MSCERGLQSVPHLPTVLTPQRGCKVRDRPIDYQKRKSIQQAPRELSISTFETRKDFCPSNDGDRKLPLHFQKICSGTRYTVEMINHNDGIEQYCRNYFCHSLRNRRWYTRPSSPFHIPLVCVRSSLKGSDLNCRTIDILKCCF